MERKHGYGLLFDGKDAVKLMTDGQILQQHGSPFMSRVNPTTKEFEQCINDEWVASSMTVTEIIKTAWGLPVPIGLKHPEDWNADKKEDTNHPVEPGCRFFSKFFNRFGTVTRYIDDDNWWFVLDRNLIDKILRSKLNELKAQCNPVDLEWVAKEQTK